MLLARSTAATARGAVAALAVLAVAAAPALAAFPGQNGRIAFHTDRAQTWEIFTMDGDGSGVLNLSNNAASDSEPAYSADGKRIAYVSYGERNIYVMNADGTSQTRITQDADGADSDPSWSPGGTRIAFARNDFSSLEIHTMDPDGSGVVKLTDSSAEDASNFDPAWSPDGSRILFTSTRTDHEGDIFVMDADGGNQTQLTTHPSRDQHPAWSPDGTRVLFASQRDGPSSIYAMNADGSGVTRLTDSGAADEDPAWSPDGTRIAFTSHRDGNREVYVMNADGSGETNLTNHPRLDRQPDWQPVHPAPPPDCQNDPSGAQEPGPVSGPLHRSEPLAGPLAPFVHRVNCDVVAPLGL